MPVYLKEEPGVVKLVVREDYSYPIPNSVGLAQVIEDGLSSWVIQVLHKSWLDNSVVLYELARIIQRDYPENNINWEKTFCIVEIVEYLDVDVRDFKEEFGDPAFHDEQQERQRQLSIFWDFEKRGNELTPEVGESILNLVHQKLKDYGLPLYAEQALRKFVQAKYASALKEVMAKRIGEEVTALSVFEKTLVYKYTLDTYENVNEALRFRKKTEYEEHLNATLNKLPDYQGLVYRGTELSTAQLERYVQAKESEEPLVELAFTSATLSRNTAGSFSKGKGHTLFRIFSKSGKLVEQLSHYGIRSSQNEREVLFKSKTKFMVLNVEKPEGMNIITLEEI